MSIIGAASEGTLLDARHPNAGRATCVARTLWIAGWPALAAADLPPHHLPPHHLPPGGLAAAGDTQGAASLAGMVAGGAPSHAVSAGGQMPGAMPADAALSGARSAAMAALPDPVMPVPQAAAEQIVLLFTILGWRLVPAVPARLALVRDGSCIRVVPDDPALAAPLAAAGLDRLVLPLSLAALEDLAALAS